MLFGFSKPNPVPATAGIGTTRAEVRAWPVDVEATRVLEEYLSQPATGAGLAGLLEDFRGADLSGLSLGGASFFNANIEGVSFRGAYMWKANLDGALASGADFSGADLRQTEFSHAVAKGALLDGANLAGVDMYVTDLRDSSLRWTNFGGGRVVRCDLSGADLRGASFGRVALGGDGWVTDLAGAVMGGNALDDAFGVVSGPVNVGSRERPQLIDGADLAAWFAQQGAPKITVVRGG
jgi:uncharacterized protein YjbI with pentapeptide repeats